jgi:uncharacterized membrane-anchored protein
MRIKEYLCAALLLGFSQTVFCAPPETSDGGMTAEQFEASLKYQMGAVTLPNGVAKLEIPGSFRYLGPDDAKRVLEDAWGNPPGATTLGMLFPANIGPLHDNGWGVVITYDEDGHVSDEDVDKIDYRELLTSMQESTADSNKERIKQGYQPLQLIGWAEPPRYEKNSHKLYWAKELKFGDRTPHTLNYNIRVLGREGVLILNAVASMKDLKTVKQDMQKVLAFTDFVEGQRYADYNSATDKLATYGIAALIGGAVAAKTGLLAKLGVLLLAAKKFIVLIVVVIAGLIAALFKRKKPKIDA